MFPPETSYSLAKTKVALPQDFAGQLNLLLISFEREQQRDIDTWKPLATDLQRSRPDLRTYMLPVFPHENMLYRWWLALSLRSDVQSAADLEFTVPLYVNKGQFRQALGIASEKQISILLTDRSGHVLWRETGPMDDRKKAALSAFVAASKTGGGR